MGLYAVLVMFISGKVSDLVVAGSNTMKSVQIITDHPGDLKDMIFQSVERGVSVIPAEGGYTNQKKTMLITVITRDEYYMIRKIIAKIDPNAFVFTSPATEIHGDFTQYSEDD